MARTVNELEHAAKREALLDATQELINTRGYAQTSVQSVLDAVGISKGAFYHYFESKPALMLALVERRGAALESLVLPIIDDPALLGIEKLTAYFELHDRFKRGRQRFVLELTHIWYADENAVLRQQLTAESRSRLVPWLSRIISQGRVEGSFTTANPDQTARIITAIIDAHGEMIAHQLPEDGQLTGDSIRAATEATAEAIERVLGTKPGTFASVWRNALAGWGEGLK